MLKKPLWQNRPFIKNESCLRVKISHNMQLLSGKYATTITVALENIFLGFNDTSISKTGVNGS
jgi:hypothetical protein